MRYVGGGNAMKAKIMQFLRGCAGGMIAAHRAQFTVF